MIIIIYPKLSSNLSIDSQSLEIFSMDPKALHRITGSQFFLLLSIFLNLTLASLGSRSLSLASSKQTDAAALIRLKKLVEKDPCGILDGWDLMQETCSF